MWRKIISLLLALALIPNLCLAGGNFDGVDDVVNCGSGASLDNMTAITVSAWIYLDTVSQGTYPRIVAKETTAGAGWRFYALNDATPAKTIAFAYDYATTDVERVGVANAISTTTWTHILATWDGSSTATNIHLYVNGGEITYYRTDNGVGAKNSDASESLFIGNRNDLNRDFDGTISEVAVWNMVLSADQIALLASSKVKRMPLQLSDPDADGTNELVGYWSMDEVADGASADLATFFDLSGNGNSGNPDNGANNTGMTGVAESVLSYMDEFGQ